MESLLSNILAFIETQGISESQFGLLALNDKNFIADIRGDGGKRPRRIWPETEAKVRLFIATYRPDALSTPTPDTADRAVA